MTRNPFHCTTTSKPAPHFKRIDYDPWAQFEFKDELTGAEMKEKAALEKKNMVVIEKVYQRLKDDEEIQGCIRQILAHPWVRVGKRMIKNNNKSTYGARRASYVCGPLLA